MSGRNGCFLYTAFLFVIVFVFLVLISYIFLLNSTSFIIYLDEYKHIHKSTRLLLNLQILRNGSSFFETTLPFLILNALAGIFSLGFSLRVETINALADVRLLTLITLPLSINYLPVCIPT
jgi:hypothetical protein